jgi:hypothetical protein
MVSTTQRPAGPSPRAVAFTAIGWLGLAACLTMVFLGMRSVMDVGGSCADGGPYVSAQSCPDGATPSLLLGIFAGFGFGALASIGGAAVGGIWAATPLLAWSGLFGSLGFNFMDYGVFSAPADTGIEWGWAICGILFWAMAAGPLLAVLPIARLARPRTGGDTVVRIGGPSQPERPMPATPLRIVTPHVERRPEAERAALAGLAADFGAAVTAAAAEAPVAPQVRGPSGGHGTAGGGSAGAPPAPGEPEFTEGTQALLDRLERLADMRDRGLLDGTEYETAKAAIMAELEGRS